jgi:hypothetical protein
MTGCTITGGILRAGAWLGVIAIVLAIASVRVIAVKIDGLNR